MSQILVIIFTTIILLIIIGILKRIFYFQSDKSYLQLDEKYKEFTIKHLYGLKLDNNYKTYYYLLS